VILLDSKLSKLLFALADLFEYSQISTAEEISF